MSEMMRYLFTRAAQQILQRRHRVQRLYFEAAKIIYFASGLRISSSHYHRKDRGRFMSARHGGYESCPAGVAVPKSPSELLADATR